MKKQNYYIIVTLFVIIPTVAILSYYRNTINFYIQICIGILICSFMGLLLAIINIAQTIFLTIKQSNDTKSPVKYKGDYNESKFVFDQWVGEQLEFLCRQQINQKNLTFSDEMSADKVIHVNKYYNPVNMGGIIKVNGEFYYVNENTRSLLQQGGKKELKGYLLPDELQKYFSNIL